MDPRWKPLPPAASIEQEIGKELCKVVGRVPARSKRIGNARELLGNVMGPHRVWQRCEPGLRGGQQCADRVLATAARARPRAHAFEALACPTAAGERGKDLGRNDVHDDEG